MNFNLVDCYLFLVKIVFKVQRASIDPRLECRQIQQLKYKLIRLNRKYQVEIRKSLLGTNQPLAIWRNLRSCSKFKGSFFNLAISYTKITNTLVDFNTLSDMYAHLVDITKFLTRIEKPHRITWDIGI
jgi:hypothetical protein